MKVTPTLVLAALVALLGVFFFVASVGGALFAAATPMSDIGLYSVTVVLLGLGGLGIWAHIAEQKEKGDA